MAQVASRRKPGRPPLPPGEGKKVPLNMRTTQAVRDRLVAAAGRSGRSLVHEVEYRLEQTFKEEDALGGRERYALFKMMAGAADLIEERMGKSATADWGTSIAIWEAWRRLFVGWAPTMPRKLKAKIEGLPPSPEPTPPAPVVGGLLFPEIANDAQKAEYEKAMREHTRALEKERRLLEKHHQKMKELFDYFEDLANIGRETALGLFPEKRKKQG